MATKTLIINKDNVPGNALTTGLHLTSDYERSVATMRLVSITHPSSVEPGEVFTLKCTYQFVERLWRNTSHEINDAPLENWPEYHGAHRRCYAGLPYLCSQHHFWIWRVEGMNISMMGNLIGSHLWSDLTDGRQWTYTFTGTIEELTGEEFPESRNVGIPFKLEGFIYGWYSQEWWPWNWTLNEEWGQTHLLDEISKSIYVDVPPPPPPPPYPLFNLSYCSVSKSEVAPNETFGITVRIVNQVEHSGKYIIGCICEAKYLKLGEGNIGGNATVNRTFNVTANQLAQRAITESQFLSFTITAENEEQQTDSWTPAAIAVIVDDPQPVAQLSGRVTDKNTGAGIGGATVKVGSRTTSTSSTGYYSFADLVPGSYTITFTATGYWTETQTKTLPEGSNTLNVAMTPDSETPPGEGIPWHIIAAGGAVAIGVVLIISGLKGDK